MADRGFEMVRYGDDFMVPCRSEAESPQPLKLIRDCKEAARFYPHPVKTWIVDASQSGGFDFLGYHFERGHRWPRKESLKKNKVKVRKETKYER